MRFGFTNLSIIPVRLEPKEQSEMVTQLLFGDLYQVISLRKKWVQIKIDADGYEGFIDRLMFFEITEKEHTRLLHAEHIYNNNLLAQAEENNHPVQVVQGSRLPVGEEHSFMVGNKTWTYQNEQRINKPCRETIKQTALSYLNTPYLWGGKTPFGIDCSGFTQMVYRINGILIPRDASQQVSKGIARNFADEAQVGDLAFFDNEEGNVIHVGIVLEDRKIIHASGKVRIDRLDHQGIFNEERQGYTHKLRVIQNLL